MKLANRLLALLLPHADSEGISGDLREEYDQMLRRGSGTFWAAIWYWMQALRAVVPGTGRRFLGIREIFSTGWSREVCLALRQFVRAPAFSLVVVFTLAIGIGVNTAIFSFVNALILRPFPFPHPDQLVEVYAFNGFEKTRLSCGRSRI